MPTNVRMDGTAIVCGLVLLATAPASIQAQELVFPAQPDCESWIFSGARSAYDDASGEFLFAGWCVDGKDGQADYFFSWRNGVVERLPLPRYIDGEGVSLGGISSDGSVIAGNYTIQRLVAGPRWITVGVPVLYTDGAKEMLPCVGDFGEGSYCKVSAVSADGSAAIGTVHDAASFQFKPNYGLRWDGGAVAKLGLFPAELRESGWGSLAYHISGDGSTLYGGAALENKVNGVFNIALRWTGTNVESVGDSLELSFMASNFDGSVAVGHLFHDGISQIYRWEDGVEELLPVPVPLVGNLILSGDGRVMVGGLGEDMFAWTRETSFIALAELFEVDPAEIPDGVGNPMALSTDGTQLLGLSSTTNQNHRFWIADLTCIVGGGGGTGTGKRSANCECQTSDVDWTGTTGGPFETEASWMNSVAPTGAEFATFPFTGAQTVDLGAEAFVGGLKVRSSAELTLNLDGNTLDISIPCLTDPPNALIVGTGTGSNASLVVSSGRITQEGSTAAIGTNGGSGHLKLINGAVLDQGLTSASELHVGQKQFTTGVVEILDGSQVLTQAVIQGRQVGSNGDVMVSGATSSLRATLALIGGGGGGTLLLNDGSSAEVQSITLGAEPGSGGDLFVEGPATVFGFSQDGAVYDIGVDGRGHFGASDGATVALQPDALVNVAAGSGSGSLRLAGSGTSMGSVGILSVGVAGEGVVRVENGATLDVAQIIVSESADPRTDSLVVSGVGSVFTAEFGDEFDDVKNVIGAEGRGAVQVMLGARLHVINSLGVGFRSGGEAQSSRGRLNVVDPGTTAEINRNLYIGYRSGLDSTGGEVHGNALVARSAVLTVEGALLIGGRGQHPEEVTTGELEVTGASQVNAEGRLGVLAGGTVRVGNGSLIETPFAFYHPESTVSGRTHIRKPGANKRTGQTDTGIVAEAVFIADGAVVDFDSVFVEGGTLGGGITWPSDLTNLGVVSPGDSVGLPGTFTVDADYTQAATGILQVDLGGTSAGAQHDVLSVTGTATLDGALEFATANDFVPTVGDRFEIVTAEQIDGTFRDVVQPDGFGVTLVYSGQSVFADVVNVVSVEGAPDSASQAGFELHANYPNPFADRTTVTFTLPEPGQVRLTIVDLLGREIAVGLDATRQAGVHQIVIDAGAVAVGSREVLPSGIYFYRLEFTSRARREVETRRMVVLR